MELIERMKALVCAQGVSGGEEEAGMLLADWCREMGLGEVSIDHFCNVICTLRSPKPGEPHLLLQAHLDEIGFMVTGVDDDGLLTVTPCGGLDRRLLLASPVTVFTEVGKLPGVVAYCPSVLSGEEQKLPKADEMKIDIGFEKEKAEQMVFPGDRIVSDMEPVLLENGLLTSKSLDNRCGCISVLRAGELIAQNLKALKCGVTLLFGAMEEVGSQGTRVAAFGVDPTHAIAVDVSFAATHDMSVEKYEGKLGNGPMLGYSPILSREMYHTLAELAEQNGITIQKEIMGGDTGTDADAIATTRCGVITGLLSVPQRYMHTPVEVIDPKDVEDTARLMAAYALQLSGEGGDRK